MFGIHLHELLIVLAIFTLLFGGTKIPQIARALGRSITEFKGGLSGRDEETALATTDNA